MTKVKLIILVIITAIGFASCQKIAGHVVSGTGSTTTGGSTTGGSTSSNTYNSTTISSTTNVRMFASAGEITNAALISSFLTRNNITNLYVNGQPASPYTGNNGLSIQIASNNTAALIQGGAYFATKVSYNGGDIKFTRTDTLNDVIGDQGTLDMMALKNGLCKYKAVYDILLPPGNGGNPFSGYLHSYLSEYYATQSGSQLNYPVIFGTVVRITKTPQVFSTSVLGFNMNNRFGGVGNQNLGALDTVVFQEFNVVLTR